MSCQTVLLGRVAEGLVKDVTGTEQEEEERWKKDVERRGPTLSLAAHRLAMALLLNLSKDVQRRTGQLPSLTPFARRERESA